jgi:DNA-binding SARP family transcriptional activator
MKRLFLMGAVRIEDGDRILDQFRSRRAAALLIYLVCQRQPVPRSELVELIWPDKPEKRGRANLRWSLNYLGKLLPDCWRVSRQTAQFQPGEEWWVDVLALQEALAADDLVGLETAVAAAGEFCRGFYLNESPQFETWLLTQRERWRQRQITAYNRLIAHHASRGAHETALPIARRLQALDPWNETAQRQVMELLARTGDFNQALAEYERFRQILEKEFQVKPALETEKIRQRVLWARRASRHNLPATSDMFIGRADELARLREWLHDDAVRLITISGVGGIGKTRLGLEAARDGWRWFINGVLFVPLEGIDDAAELPSMILQTLVEADSIPPPPLSQDPAPYLIEQLQQREMLLFLDNYEQLLPEAEFLQSILKAAPHLKLLVTSRERMRLRRERLLVLSGLPQMADARRLFLARAHVGEEEGVAVIEEICRLVDRLPLAIELAAGWAQVQSLPEIAAELRQGLGVLVDRFQDREARHVSIEAVFAQSWQRLKEGERDLLLHLAAFHVPFAAAWALQIGAATRSDLAGLLDKSLLQRRGRRFQLHPLLHQFVLNKWEPAIERRAKDRHLDLFVDFLQRHHAGLYGQARGEAVNAIAEALPEITAAWRWACINKREAILSQMQRPLRRFFSIHGPLRLGTALFQTASNAFPIETPLGAQLQLSKAWLLEELGRYEAAQENSLELLSRAEPFLSPADVAVVHYVLGMTFYMRGKYGEARRHCKRVLAFPVAGEETWVLTRAHGLLGLIALAEIDFDDQGVFQAHNWRPERLEVAIGCFEQSLRLAREEGEPGRIVSNLHNIGYCRWREEDFSAAAALFRSALQIAERSGGNGAQTRNWLAVTQASMGQFAAAEATAQQALQEAWQIQRLTIVMDVLSTLGAKIFMHVERTQEAITLLTFVAAHPRTDARIVQRSRLALDELRDQISPAAFRAAEAEAATLSLDQVLAAYVA